MASTVLPSEVAFPELGVLYLSFALFNLFGAAPLTDRIGTRPAMFFATLTYTVFDFSNVIAIAMDGKTNVQLAILLVAAILIGAGAAVLWSAQGAYVIKCSSKDTIGRYTGIFFGIYSAANCIGPLFTSGLLAANFNKEDAFKILGGVGALGPLILIYLWAFRPEPSNPNVVEEDISAAAAGSETHLFLRAGKIIISKKMLMVAMLIYLNAFAQTFSTGTLPLFIKTDNSDADLRTKLYLASAYGASLMLSSFTIGPITDMVNNPFLIVVVDGIIYMIAISALWIAPSVQNNLALLYPINILCAVNDATLLNQIYKIVAGLFRNDTTSYAAMKFHSAGMTGICFFLSKVMLGKDGFPRMQIWVPVLGVLFVGAVAATWVSTREIDWRPKGERVVVEVVVEGGGKVGGVDEVNGVEVVREEKNGDGKEGGSGSLSVV
ncbi:DUF895 domain membrane protein [Podochytrium sp. JEL0797]|nr:DUF895 domain membrane protein [Podochytrium sp. JEL0797]